MALYRDLLGRGADPTGLEGWSRVLSSGTSQAALVSSLTSSSEYVSLRIAGAYRQVLGRDPDSSGAQAWSSLVLSGQMSVDAVTRAHLGSAEFFSRAGGTDEGLVRLLYQSVLGRSATAADVTAWATAARVHGRAWVIDAIWWSPEAVGGRVNAYFHQFLGRGVDPTGLATWSQVLLVHGEGAVRTGIAGSQEYANRAIARFPPAPVQTWPGRSNTGVPPGTRLTVHEGDLKITQDGTVIDGLEIRGLVRVEAKDVVIKNSLITGRHLSSDLSLIYVNGPGWSVTVQDSELYARHPSPHVMGVIGQNFTLERVNIHQVIDQVHIIGDNVLVRDSWLHDNLHYLEDPSHGGTPSHDDNVQIQAGRNIRIVGNTMESTHNAAVQVTQDTGVVADVLIERNRISHGACALNLAQKSRGPLQGFVVRENVFTRTQVYPGCAMIVDSPSIPLLTLSGNTWSDGAAVSVTRR